MKLLILSDSHDRVDTLHQIALWAKDKEIEGVIHCGDVASLETVEYLKVFGKPVWLSLGNADVFDETDVTGMHVFPDIGTWNQGCSVAFVHYPDKAAMLAQSQQYDFVFYGHTHKPWLEKVGRTYLVNPGNVAGTRFPASFAVLYVEKKVIECVPLYKIQNTP